MIVTEQDEKVSKEIRRTAMLRFYNEHLARIILEIEKLQDEAMGLEGKIGELG